MKLDSACNNRVQTLQRDSSAIPTPGLLEVLDHGPGYSYKKWVFPVEGNVSILIAHNTCKRSGSIEMFAKTQS